MSIANSLRKIHYWATAFLAIPLLVIVGTGILLQLKKNWSFVQPTELRGHGTEPGIDLSDILDSARRADGAGVASWNDVRRIDIRPDRGVAKVWTRNDHEVQIDLSDGAVLQTAVRRSDLIESLHDGSFFGGEMVKLGVFLPVGVGLLFMLASGVWLFLHPILARRAAKRGRTSR